MVDESQEQSSVKTAAESSSLPLVSDPVTHTLKSGTTPTTAYRSALDTTPRKVVVHNVLKFTDKKQIEALIESWKKEASDGGFRLVVERFRKPPRNGWVTLTLAEDSMVEPFIRFINDTKRLNKQGYTMVARRPGETDKAGKKRGRNDTDEFSNSKRARPEVPERPTFSQIRDKMTAKWSEPYSTQLAAKKTDMIRHCSFKIVKEMKSKFRTLEKEAKRNPKHCEKPRLFSWLTAKPGISVEDVVASPLVMKYRNKCELTFGYRSLDESESTDGSPSRIPAVGFLPYGWRHSVARPHCLQNIPDEVCAVADLVDQFLATSPLLPYDTNVHRGIWRSLTIRSSERTGQVMLIVVHASPEGGAGEEKSRGDENEESTKIKRDLFETERDRLVSMLTNSELAVPTRDIPLVQMEEDSTTDTPSTIRSTRPFRVTSIFFQEYNGLSNPSVSHPTQHVYGSKFMEEKLGSNTYQISPGAFFQVTTAGAEVLYNIVAERIKEVSNDPEGTLLFDVCCGTGTIGLHCLSENVVGRVVGIDISEPAIEDALANAKRNGYGEDCNKTRFIASRAEHVMGKELRRVNDKPPRSIVAVVDPARDGLHPDVIKAIRSTKEIQRLVYVSCNPTGSLVRDAAILCSRPTKKYRGLPFKPTKAQPVDMFPLTPHCEMVMTFDRMTDEEVKGEPSAVVSNQATKEETIEVTNQEEAN